MTDLGEDGDHVLKILVGLCCQGMAKVGARQPLTSRADTCADRMVDCLTIETGAAETIEGNRTMSLNTIIVQGTLKPDGTLELDEKPTLAPGRVHVVLQPISTGSTSNGGLAQTIEEIRLEQQARGYRGRTPEEMVHDDDERRADEESYEQRMQEIWSQTQAGTSAEGP
jgi:hypothetical protein